MSWIEAPLPEGAPTIPVLGASTMAHTSQGSPSVAVLPPDEGVVLEDVDSVGRAGSLSGSRADCPNVSEMDGSGMDVSLTSLTSAVVPFFFNCYSGGCFYIHYLYISWILGLYG